MIENSNDVNNENLRPQLFDDYIGQTRIIDSINLMTQSASLRDAPLGHLLLSGPPGLGKTTLGSIISTKLKCNISYLSAPTIDSKGEFIAVLTSLGDKDLLFIDELHRLNKIIEELLYSAMEDFHIDVVLGEGANAKAIRLNLPRFTLIGATTRPGLLSSPLRTRFVRHLQFEYYSNIELEEIVLKSSRKLGIKLVGGAALNIAERARGTPRIANKILLNVRDFATVNRLQAVSEKDVIASLKLIDIDEYGFDLIDRKILLTIDKVFNGGPVGISSICAILEESKETIESVHEPYLLRKGVIVRTPRGRMLTDHGKHYLRKNVAIQHK